MLQPSAAQASLGSSLRDRPTPRSTSARARDRGLDRARADRARARRRADRGLRARQRCDRRRCPRRALPASTSGVLRFVPAALVRLGTLRSASQLRAAGRAASEPLGMSLGVRLQLHRASRATAASRQTSRVQRSCSRRRVSTGGAGSYANERSTAAAIQLGTNASACQRVRLRGDYPKMTQRIESEPASNPVTGNDASSEIPAAP